MCFCRYFVSLSQVRYEHPYQKEIPVSVKDTGILLFIWRFLELECGNFKTQGFVFPLLFPLRVVCLD